MAFTMSYGATPSSAPAETISKAVVPKKPAPRRGLKRGSLQTQAQALFDPALARSPEAPSPEAPSPAAMDVPDDGAASPLRTEQDGAARLDD